MQALLIMASETIFGEINIFPPLSQDEKDYLSLFLKKTHVTIYENTELIETLYKVHSSTKISKTEKIQEFLEQEDGWQNHILGIKTNDLTPFGSIPLSVNEESIKVIKKSSFKNHIGEWLAFLIEHFFKENSIAKTIYPEEFSFLQPHQLKGSIYLKGTEYFKVEHIHVNNNLVYRSYGDYSSHPLYSLHNPNTYKKLHIKDLLNYEHATTGIFLNLPESNFLDKLLLKEDLSKKLEFNKKNQKQIKL